MLREKKLFPPFESLMAITGLEELKAPKPNTTWKKQQICNYTVFPPVLGSIFMSYKKMTSSDILCKLIIEMGDKTIQEIIKK